MFISIAAEALLLYEKKCAGHEIHQIFDDKDQLISRKEAETHYEYGSDGYLVGVG